MSGEAGRKSRTVKLYRETADLLETLCEQVLERLPPSVKRDIRKATIKDAMIRLLAEIGADRIADYILGRRTWVITEVTEETTKQVQTAAPVREPTVRITGDDTFMFSNGTLASLLMERLYVAPTPLVRTLVAVAVFAFKPEDYTTRLVELSKRESGIASLFVVPAWDGNRYVWFRRSGVHVSCLCYADPQLISSVKNQIDVAKDALTRALRASVTVDDLGFRTIEIGEEGKPRRAKLRCFEVRIRIDRSYVMKVPSMIDDRKETLVTLLNERGQDLFGDNAVPTEATLVRVRNLIAEYLKWAERGASGTLFDSVYRQLVLRVNEV